MQKIFIVKSQFLMRAVKYVVLLMAPVMSINSASAGTRQYTSLSRFKGTFNKQFGYAGKENVSFFTNKTEPPIMKISESKRYCSYAGINLNDFSGMNSVFIGVDCKTSNIANAIGACIYYYWLDKKGKKIGNGRYILRQSGTSDWQHFEKIVTSPAPLNTNGICIAFSLYSSKDKDGSHEGYVLYKNPVIRVAKDQDGESVKKAALARKKNKADLIGGPDLGAEDPDAAGELLRMFQRESMNQSSHLAAAILTQIRDMPGGDRRGRAFSVSSFRPARRAAESPTAR